jgi:hypothetical protein
MKSRWIIAAILCVAIGALVAYIASNTYWDDITLPAPLRGEAVTNPFYASQKFAAALGATTEWRHSLGALPNGDVVVVLSHWHWDLIQDRRQQLEEWVSAGGRVVIDRTLIGGEEHLETWAGIRRVYSDDDEDTDDEDTGDEDTGDEDAGDEEVATEAEPANADSLPAGELCKTLHVVDSQGKAQTNGREFSVCKLDGFSHLATDREIAWGLASEHGLEALRVNVGRGSVTSINANPFGNRDLMEMDHGVLFVAASQLRRGDRVIFISERDHTSLLGLIWIHGAPVVVLFLIMLAALLWRGGVRFGPLSATTDAARRSIAEQIRGTGQFTIRLGGGKALHAAAVRALQEAASRRIARYSGLPHVERIAAIAQAAGIDSDTLAQAVNQSGARRPGELAHTIATLETARRKILDHHA